MHLLVTWSQLRKLYLWGETLTLYGPWIATVSLCHFRAHLGQGAAFAHLQCFQYGSQTSEFSKSGIAIFQYLELPMVIKLPWFSQNFTSFNTENLSFSTIPLTHSVPGKLGPPATANGPWKVVVHIYSCDKQSTVGRNYYNLFCYRKWTLIFSLGSWGSLLSLPTLEEWPEFRNNPRQQIIIQV